MALVVVAEDDSGTLKLIGVTLKNQGHEVLTAGDGISAWALIREHRAEVIVSDVDMPGMNGFDLLQRVREHPDLGQTPFILLTSLQERRGMRQGMNLGADDYITKPLRPRELIDAVSAQLDRHAVRQAARALEVQTALTDALAKCIGLVPFHGYRFQGRRFDCGSKLGYLEANLAYGLERVDLKADVREMLKKFV